MNFFTSQLCVAAIVLGAAVSAEHRSTDTTSPQVGQPCLQDSYTASGTAPGGDNTVSAICKTSGSGALTITRVKKNGTILKEGTDYTISNNGSSSPDITFLDAVPEGTTIQVDGTAAGSGGPYTGQLDWD